MNGDGLSFHYHHMREGPNYFSCYYRDSAVIRRDPKDAWRQLGAAKFTPTGKDLKEWCLSVSAETTTDQSEDVLKSSSNTPQ